MHEILKRRTKGFWLENSDTIKDSLTNQSLNKSEYKLVFKNILQAYDNNKIGVCLNWLLVAFLYDQEKTIIFIKKSGLLRFSRDFNKTKFKNSILSTLLKYKDKYEFNESTEHYLTARFHLSKLSGEVFQINLEIISGMRSVGQHLVKDLLIILDKCFYAADKPSSDFQSESIYDLSPEDLGNSVAYLIYIYIQKNGIPSNNLLSRVSENPHNNNYLPIILKATKIQKFEKAEVLLDSFGFNCNYENSEAIISSPDNFLEKAIRYGFIHSDLQRANQTLSLAKEHESNVASLSLLSDKFYEIKDQIIFLVEEPVPRYVLSLPEIPQLLQQLKEKALFLEEVIEISRNENEHLISKGQLIDFKVTDNLTLWDLILVKRIFVIFSNIFYKHLSEVYRYDPVLADRSWLPAFTEESLVTLLSSILSEHKATEYIDIYSWKEGDSKVLDLQYLPMIKVDNGFLLCINVLAKSHSFRNVLVTNNIRPIDSINTDLSSKALYDVLKRKFNNVEMELKFNKEGFHGDFDVLLYADKTIYAFECKNIIMPAGFYELRTTFNNLSHGFEQLGKYQKALNNTKFIEYLNRKTNWNIAQNELQVVTCLVLSNRMFNGYTDGTHHVRPLYELVNFIETGVINTQNASYSTWESDEISSNDLRAYIKYDRVHSLVFSSMDEYIDREPLVRRTLSFRTFALNIELLIESISSTFRKLH